MAATITLPGAGAIDLDVQEARILNVGLLTVEGTYDQTDVDNSAAPRTYIDQGDVRAYDPAATYQINDYVLSENRIWFADVVITNQNTEAPSDTSAVWTELTRNNIFLHIMGDGGEQVSADDLTDTIHIVGGSNIDTVGGDGTGGARDTLTIDWSANLDDLADVLADTPTNGYFLQWNGTAWVPAEVVGSGYTILSDGTTTVEVTTARQTIEVTGTGPVATAVTSDANSANVAISVADATTSQEGLLTAADKTLLDDVRDGGYANSGLELRTNQTQLELTDGTDVVGSTQLAEVLSLANLSDVGSLTGVSEGEVLAFNAAGMWSAVHPEDLEEHGGRIWDSEINYSIGDVVSILVTGTYRQYIATQANTDMNPTTDGTPWQEASILRLRDIANIDISADPANNSLLIWNADDSDWEVTTAQHIVELTDAVRRNDFSQGIRDGRILSVRWPDSDGTIVTYPFGERPIVRGAWDGATAACLLYTSPSPRDS